MLETDYAVKRRLLECARLLTDRQLDAPMALRHSLVRWNEPARMLRDSFCYLAGTGVGCTDVMYDTLEWQPSDVSCREIVGNSAEAMITHLDGAHKAFLEFVAKVRAENIWDQEWIDDSCDQPETFAIGRVIEESLTASIACRTMLERQMVQMGFDLEPGSCLSPLTGAPD